MAQTTRRRLRAVVNREDCQLVIVDTPGIHKPKDGLGSELNKSALGELADVDVIAFVIDASAPIGRGDAWSPSAWLPPRHPRCSSSPRRTWPSPEQMLKQLEAARALGGLR
ncbi:MAG: GTPase [Collinsella sp.]